MAVNLSRQEKFGALIRTSLPCASPLGRGMLGPWKMLTIIFFTNTSFSQESWTCCKSRINTLYTRWKIIFPFCNSTLIAQKYTNNYKYAYWQPYRLLLYILKNIYILKIIKIEIPCTTSCYPCNKWPWHVPRFGVMLQKIICTDSP